MSPIELRIVCDKVISQELTIFKFLKQCLTILRKFFLIIGSLQLNKIVRILSALQRIRLLDISRHVIAFSKTIESFSFTKSYSELILLNEIFSTSLSSFLKPSKLNNFFLIEIEKISNHISVKRLERTISFLLLRNFSEISSE